MTDSPNAPPDPDEPNLVSLARLKSDAGRAALFERMAKILDDSGRAVAEKEKALAGDILLQLLGEVEKGLRSALARRLAARDDAPVPLIKALSSDEIDVSAPVLEQSPVLTDADLIGIVRDAAKGHLLAIARRRDLDASVGQALIDRDEPEVTATLIDNDSAELTEGMLAFLVQDAKWQPDLQPPLVARSDLPLTLAARLYTYVALPLKSALQGRYGMDDAVIARMIAESVDTELAAWAASRKTGTKTQALVWSMYDRGELALDPLVNGLMHGETEFFREGLALLTGLPGRVVRRLLLSDDRRASAVLLRTLNAGPEMFSRVYRLTRLDGSSDPAEVRRLDREAKAIYQSVDPAKARAVMRKWQTGLAPEQALIRLLGPA